MGEGILTRRQKEGEVRLPEYFDIEKEEFQLIEIDEDADISSICYGNGLFVALPNRYAANYFLISSDGTHWSKTELPESQKSWEHICYGNNLFVAISSDDKNNILVSSDGLNWTVIECTSISSGWSDICYGDSLYVMVQKHEYEGQVKISTNGYIWTNIDAPIGKWSSICYGNGIYVALSTEGENKVMTSSDGIRWILHNIFPGESWWTSICYGNGRFVAVSMQGSHQIMTSTDGINWTFIKSPEQNRWRSICYGNGIFLAVAASGSNRAMYSFDGISWYTKTTHALWFWSSISYGKGKFIITAQHSNITYGLSLGEINKYPMAAEKDLLYDHQSINTYKEKIISNNYYPIPKLTPGTSNLLPQDVTKGKRYITIDADGTYVTRYGTKEETYG